MRLNMCVCLFLFEFDFGFCFLVFVFFFELVSNLEEGAGQAARILLIAITHC